MFGREAGSKVGSAGVANDQQAAIQRRERLRLLAMESIDLSKDPYIFKNHLGSFECKLCQTLHTNEANYLAHTQGKRHQTNLARRAARQDVPVAPTPTTAPVKMKIQPRRTIKIGRPGYRVTKQQDAETGGKSLLFQMEYPEIEDGSQPLFRFMSAFEQRKEPPHASWQLIQFAAEPYETVAFKIPNMPMYREAGTDKFWSHWDPATRTFSLQLVFKPEEEEGEDGDEEQQNADGVQVEDASE